MSSKRVTPETKDSDLIEMAERGGSGQGALAEMMRRLRKDIVELNESTCKQQRTMVVLTWAIAAFTLVIMGLTIAQLLSS